MTPITAIGLRPINTLQPGDQVLAYNEATATNGYYPITAVMHHNDDQVTTLSLQAANGSSETINTTPEHPFYVAQTVDGGKRPSPIGHEELNSHWVGAGHLLVGDKLKLANGQVGTVRNVTTLQKTQEMFNLTVQTAHTFYVGNNGWLVHNGGPCAAIGFAPGEGISALQGMNNGGGHAIRHLIAEGVIPNVGSLASKVTKFAEIAVPILEHPTLSFFWTLRGGLHTKGFIGDYQGKQIVIWVATEGDYAGKVVASATVKPGDLHLWGFQ